jgi:hypothetical protein
MTSKTSHFAGIVLALSGAAAMAAFAQSGASIGLNFQASLYRPDGAASTYDKYIPPDTDGAVGPNHIVELLNDHYSIFRKSDGVRLNPVTDRDVEFWNQAGIPITDPPGLTDPRVIFDKSSQHWFAAELTYLFDANGNLIPNDVLVAASKTSDPTKGWRGYRIAGTDPGTNPGDAGFFFVDYPTLGVNALGVYITTNNFDSDFNFVSVSMFAVNRSDLISGKTPRIGRFSGLDPSVYGVTQQPVIQTGTSAGQELLLSVPADLPSDHLLLTTLSAEGPSPQVLSVSVPTYSVQVSGGLQPDGSQTLETLDPRFDGSVSRVNNDIWAVHSVDALYGEDNHRTAIRWYRIDANTGTLGDTGTLSDASHDYIMPSIAANNAGIVVIGFSRTGLDEFPSAYAAVGHTAKGKTTFDSPILLKAGEGLYHFIPGLPEDDRWGDFSATQLDPNDPNTFWTFQEWAAAPFDPPLFGVIEGRWATQVTQITVPTQQGANQAEALAVDLTRRAQAQADAAAGAVLRAARVAPPLQLKPKATYTLRSR